MRKKQLLAILLSSNLFISGTCVNVSADDLDNNISKLESMCKNLKETDANREYKHELEELLNSFTEESKNYIELMNILFEGDPGFKKAETVDEINTFAQTYLNKLLTEAEHENENTELEEKVQYICDILSNRSNTYTEFYKKAKDLVERANAADTFALIKMQEQIKQQAKSSNDMESQTIRVLNHIRIKKPPKHSDNSNSSETTFDISREDYQAYAIRKSLHVFLYQGKKVEEKSCSLDLSCITPSITDIKQSNLGNCFFLSALGATLYSRPEIIKNSIRDNHDGTVTIRFYDKKQKPCYYTIRKSVPKDVSYKNKDWVKLFEKAYVLHVEYIQDSVKQFIHSYDIIDGGSTSDALMHITGSKYIRVGKFSDVDLEGHGKVGDYSDYVTKHFIPSLKKRFNNNYIFCAVNHETHSQDGVYRHHAYAVLGMEEKQTKTGKKLLLMLRNPWGDGIPHYVKNSDNEYTLKKCAHSKQGVFLLDVNDFLKYFDTLYGIYIPE